MEPVTAGIIKDITNLIKTFSQTLSKFFDGLSNIGLDVEKSEKTSQGGTKITVRPSQKTNDKAAKRSGTVKGNEDNIAEITTDPIKDKDGYVHLVVKVNKTSPHDFGDVKDTDVEQLVTDYLEQGFGSAFKGALRASRTMSVRLQKVTTGTKTGVELSGIFCGTNTRFVQDELETIIGDDEFFDSLGETGQWFEVVDDGSDELDVHLVEEEPDWRDAMKVILEAAIISYNNIKAVHWGAKGHGFRDLHETCDEYTASLLEDIDTWGELHSELFGWAPNPGKIDNEMLLEVPDGFTYFLGFTMVKDTIDWYVDILQTYQVNFTQDIQSQMDDIIRNWRHEVDYKVARRLKDYTPAV